MITFACPKCGMAYREPETGAGRKFFCTNTQCGQKIQVPVSQDQLTAAGIPLESKRMAASKSGEWFYEQGGVENGPVTQSDLKHLAKNGHLVPSTRVWTRGMNDWQPAEKAVPALFSKPKRVVVEETVEVGGDRSAGKWESLGFVLFALVATGILVALGFAFVPKLLNNKKDESAKKEDVPAKVEPQTELSWKDITKQSEKSVAQVRNRLGTGSGFLIRPGILVTNAHVTNEDLIEHHVITFPSSGSNKKYKAELLYEDRKRDLAILKIDVSLPPLPLAKQDPEKAEQLGVIGSPGTLAEGGTSPNSFSSGEMSNIITLVEDGLEYYQMTVPINGGNSGGPVFNTRGQVVGVATAGELAKQGVNYAIPVKDLRKAIDKATANKDKDLDPFTQEHDYITVFVQLLNGYRSKIAYMDCLAGVRRGSSERQNDLPRIEKTMTQVVQKIRILDPDINRVTSHKAIPEARKQQLRELLSDYNDSSREFGQLLGSNAAPDQLEAAAQRRDIRFKVHLSWFVLNLGKDNLR